VGPFLGKTAPLRTAVVFGKGDLVAVVHFAAKNNVRFSVQIDINQWMQSLDDISLLRQYANCGSEAAFETLVNRRIGFVYSASC
jgi:hypothetical protein